MTSIFKWIHETSLKKMEKKQNSFFVCLFDHDMYLAGSQFPSQGLNPGQGSESAKS